MFCHVEVRYVLRLRLPFSAMKWKPKGNHYKVGVASIWQIQTYNPWLQFGKSMARGLPRCGEEADRVHGWHPGGLGRRRALGITAFVLPSYIVVERRVLRRLFVILICLNKD